MTITPAPAWWWSPAGASSAWPRPCHGDSAKVPAAASGRRRAHGVAPGLHNACRHRGGDEERHDGRPEETHLAFRAPLTRRTRLTGRTRLTR
ncbi:hypothetical protein GCM10010347_50410 [Streptomyces cirratus]|uniref:Uncharacterized protein n=1 Tax=Streptomyces cirratus TaxID=68187 RepID=A0ABQ3EYH7_9ACTN|nr:hypothetical protein GCM10010347_50410 [Streptomyces cirratus]